jgi:hypothetical protein
MQIIRGLGGGERTATADGRRRRGGGMDDGREERWKGILVVMLTKFHHCFARNSQV